MLKIFGVGSVLSMLLLPLSAFGHGSGWSRTNMEYYYCPSVVYVDPCAIYGPHGSHPVLGPQPRRAPLAAPSAAPPSAGPIQSGKGQPEVTESRSFYEAFKVPSTSTDKPASERCAVGFWNLTGRDVTVSVDGKSQVIPRGKTVRLQVDRQFVWQVSGREAQTEKVPMENSGLEIVLRR